ncbi:allophanate hydrolase subunit 1 [Micromonospora sp. NPDC005298]|uniref:5-oxoprolinase subunit B family protein n=1 Tax=Micromonospora sp. NPDC005298 TaxID=3156873 RepID=UPI0033A116BD
MRIRPVGVDALLIDCAGLGDGLTAELVEAWRAELWQRRERGDLAAVEIVPAASTVLLDGLPDPTTTATLLTRWAPTVITTARQTARAANGPASAPHPGDLALSAPTERDGRAISAAESARSTDGVGVVHVPVAFDGADLPTVAEHWGVDVPAVVRRLTGTRFRVAFCGFAPGFPYLTGLPAELALPRLPTPRPRVPAGSVALAGPYAGIYPSASPGGWLLVGRTEMVLFDVHADPPARLTPGTEVRMVAT